MIKVAYYGFDGNMMIYETKGFSFLADNTFIFSLEIATVSGRLYQNNNKLAK